MDQTKVKYKRVSPPLLRPNFPMLASISFLASTLENYSKRLFTTTASLRNARYRYVFFDVMVVVEPPAISSDAVSI